MIYRFCDDRSDSAVLARLGIVRHLPAGAAALMLGASALALSSGTARADCSPAGTGGADVVLCDAVGVDNSPYATFGGADTITITGGTYAAEIQAGTGNDTVTLNGAAANVFRIEGNSNDDIINIIDGTVGAVWGDSPGALQPGNDTITMNGGTVTGNIEGNEGNDTILLNGGSVGGDVLSGAGSDTVTVTGTVITGDISGSSEDDVITLNGAGASVGSIIGGSHNDTINIIDGTVGDVFGDTGSLMVDGNDVINITGGTVTGNVDAGGANDTVLLDGGAVGGNVLGGDGNDIVDLLGGTALNVNGDAGEDTLTLNGSSLSGNVVGGADNDTINLLGGVALSAVGGTGEDLITLNGATMTVNVVGGDDNDTINLLSGQTGAVNGDAGDDLITLDGAVVTGNVLGSTGNDTINILSGNYTSDINGGAGEDTLNLNGGIASLISGGDDNDTINLTGGLGGTASGNGGDDTITLDGASMDQISGNDGNDVISLLSGSANNVGGDAGNDLITLNGASVVGSIAGGAGDDTFELTSGSFSGDLLGDVGSDTANIAAGYDLSTIIGNLDGGDDVSAGDGFVDVLNVAASGTLTGENVINWETININSASVTFAGSAMTVGGGDGFGGLGLLINGSTVDFYDGVDGVFAVTGDVEVNPGSTLLVGTPDGSGAFSVSDRLVNDGTVDMSGASPAVGDVLTVGGPYDALGGTLVMDAALDATEAGDLLVLNNTIVFSGTPIVINDLGGAASFTGTGPGAGIALVDNSGFGDIADGDFVLAGGDITKGPFVYTLSLEADNILYLQSDVLSQVYGYAILAEVMREEFPILRDRLGDRRYGRIGGPDPSVSPEDSFGVWARIDGNKREIDHDGSETTGEWEADRAEAEVGVDMPFDLFGGAAVAGISAHMITGNADARSGLSSDADKSDVNTTGFGAGLQMAFFPGGGFYADVQGRVTFWDADVKVDSQDLKQDVDATSWGASLEVGNRLRLGETTSVIPRGRVVYTDVDFSSFTDDNGVHVSQDDSASLVLEGGVTVEQLFAGNVAAIFVDASVGHDVLDDSSVDAAGFKFESGLEDTWGQLQIGLQGDVAQDASVYIAADVGSPFGSQFADTWSYGMEAGFRLDF